MTDFCDKFIEIKNGERGKIIISKQSLLDYGAALKSAWDKGNNNLLTRAKQNTKILFIGTRWSLADPISIRRALLQNHETYAYIRHRILDLPALNANDKSNFDYDHGVGFSTEFYHARCASFERTNDLAS